MAKVSLEEGQGGGMCALYGLVQRGHSCIQGSGGTFVKEDEKRVAEAGTVDGEEEKGSKAMHKNSYYFTESPAKPRA